MKTNTFIRNPNARRTYAEAIKAARKNERQSKYSSKKSRIEGCPYFLIGYLVQAINQLENEK